jgi:hypothetical protein
MQLIYQTNPGYLAGIEGQPGKTGAAQLPSDAFIGSQIMFDRGLEAQYQADIQLYADQARSPIAV